MSGGSPSNSVSAVDIQNTEDCSKKASCGLDETESAASYQLCRDAWMSEIPGNGGDFVDAFGKSPIEKRKDKERRLTRERESAIRAERELVNANQKPAERSSISASQAKNSSTDGGVGWLRRALTRAKEQASVEKRSLEDVAAERWGSLDRLLEMLRAAESKNQELSAKNSQSSLREIERYSKRGRRNRYDKHDSLRTYDTLAGHDFGGTSRKLSSSRNFCAPSDDPYLTKPRDSSSRKYDDRTSERGQKSDSNRHVRTNSSDSNKNAVCLDEQPKRVNHIDRKEAISEVGPSDSECTDTRKIVRMKPLPSKVASKLKDFKPKDFLRSSDTESRASSSDALHDNPPSSLPASSQGDLSVEGLPVSSEPVSKEQLNRLNAKLLKAEMLGKVKLAERLRQQIKAASMGESVANDAVGKDSGIVKEVLLTRTDARTGFTAPLRLKRDGEDDVEESETAETVSSQNKRRKDDAEQMSASLQELIEEERLTNTEEQNVAFAKVIGRAGPPPDQLDNEDPTVDDIFVSRKGADSTKKTKEAEIRQAIKQHKYREQTLDSCPYCIDSKKLLKHLIISMGETVYLSMLPTEPMVPGQLAIFPFVHASSSAQLDENVSKEIRQMITTLKCLWHTQAYDLIVMETSIYLHKMPHLRLDCFALPSSEGEMAPMYFKKAILEAEGEWLQNKRLIPFKFETGVSRVVPKGLPYFAVEFGTDGGFAHVIEDERRFPANFGKEIIAGLCQLEPSMWRKPKMQDFDDQMKRVAAFKKIWQSFTSS